MHAKPAFLLVNTPTTKRSRLDNVVTKKEHELQVISSEQEHELLQWSGVELNGGKGREEEEENWMHL